MGAFIRSIGAYIPEKRVTNDDLAQHIDTSDEWIRSHTGIGARHIASDDEATSDIGTAAAQLALERAGMQADELDGIILATATPDHPGFPATSCIIQHKLGVDSVMAFDVVAGCTGFIYMLEIARGLILTGHYKNIMVIGAEKLSSITNWEDRNTCVLFGDGAGAAVVSSTDAYPELASAGKQDSSASGTQGSAVLDSRINAEGSGSYSLYIPAGGSRNPLKDRTEAFSAEEVTLHMDGRRVYNFAVRVVVETIRDLLERNGLEIGDITYIVPHQANQRIIQAAAKRLSIPADKFYMNIEQYANTSAASIPIALNEMYEQGKLKRGDRILTVGFGAGLTYGGNVIVW